MYSDHVTSIILPLSVARYLPEAFREWHFTGHTVDHEYPIETCQLCGQENLRYHFEIANDQTHHQMMVGSHCILRFQVAIFDNGRELSPIEAKRRLADLTDKMHHETCLKAMRRLREVSPHEILDTCIAYYEKNDALSPKLANALFWQLASHGIAYQPGLFKIQLRRTKHLDDFAGMNIHQRSRLWPALSLAQKKRMTEAGFAPP